MNAYETRRIDRIRENKRKLGNLLDTQTIAIHATSTKDDSKAPFKKGDKRSSYVTLSVSRREGSNSRRGKQSTSNEDVERRKSSRLASLPAPVYTDPLYEDRPRDIENRLSKSQKKDDVRSKDSKIGHDKTVMREDKTLTATSSSPKHIDPRSCRAMEADIVYMRRQWLGCFLHPRDGTGAMKASVMNYLKNGDRAFIGAAGGPPKFSKYSGIQEWKNCVCLFVNVDSSDYDNMWSENGSRMLWYAQRFQTADSNVILRMTGSEDDRIPKTCVLLFIRLIGEPYVFCGSLKVYQKDLFIQPMRIVWELEDFSILRKCSNWREVVGDICVS